MKALNQCAIILGQGNLSKALPPLVFSRESATVISVTRTMLESDRDINNPVTLYNPDLNIIIRGRVCHHRDECVYTDTN